MASLTDRLLADGLTIWNLWICQRDLHLILAAQLGKDDVDVLVTDTDHHRLTGLFVVFDPQRLIRCRALLSLSSSFFDFGKTA